MAVYQTFTSMMNEKIRRQAPIANPFVFAHIRDLTAIEDFEDTGPCVVMASPGMLQVCYKKKMRRAVTELFYG